MNEITAVNVRKVTRFREDGEEALESEVHRLEREKRRVEMEEDEEGEREWVGYGSKVRRRRKGEEWEPEWKYKHGEAS